MLKSIVSALDVDPITAITFHSKALYTVFAEYFSLHTQALIHHGQFHKTPTELGDNTNIADSLVKSNG